MKRYFYFLYCIFSIILAVSCSKYRYETVPGDPLQTKIYTLDNGLKVYMSVNRETPRIQTMVVVKVGSKNDPSETTGLAHYFEHLMFKGTESFGTSDYQAEKPLLDEIEALFETYRNTSDDAQRKIIYNRIDSLSYEASMYAIPNEYGKLMAVIGADGTNAFTDTDMTVYLEDIPSNQVDNWARIEADRFMHPVLRGFHTELETVYEESNMYLTDDFQVQFEALCSSLWRNHPYGTQKIIGTQDHLKNPSITNVLNFHKTWYVPNNMAICVSGDFNPDEMVAAIEKYFGMMQPNPDLPEFTFHPEEPFASPVQKTVYGNETESLMLGWSVPGSRDSSSDIAELAGRILYNRQAGLMDLDINQQQLALELSGGFFNRPDYGTMYFYGVPKQGQGLEELRNLILAEIEKLRSGDFDESLVTSTLNNIRLERMYGLEDNYARVEAFCNSFVNGSEWKEEVDRMSNYEKISKQDVVDWAVRYLRPEGYAVVYKKVGKNPDLQLIEAPEITPIQSNRDASSDFLREIQSNPVKPVEPVFVDYRKDMKTFECQGMNVLYKNKTVNDIATLVIRYDVGREIEPALKLAADYVGYLGTGSSSSDEISARLYELACSYQFVVTDNQTYLEITGLSENIGEALEIVENLIFDSCLDEEILEFLKDDVLKGRSDAKMNQDWCFAALRNYVFYGPEYIRKSTLSNEQIKALTSEELIGKLRSVYSKQHEIMYFGSESEKSLKNTLALHHRVSPEAEPLIPQYARMRVMEQPEVYVVSFDTNQMNYVQYSDRGEKYDAEDEARILLYNTYFGGGMNSVVFQEIREARGLAYWASAWLEEPYFADGTYSYFATTATQPDKMQIAMETFDEIINNMPESQTAFDIARESLISQMRTSRTTGMDILWSYVQDRKKGLTANRDAIIFDELTDASMDDVKYVLDKYIKGRKYSYAVLGPEVRIDTGYLKTLGPLRTLTLEEIFGY